MTLVRYAGGDERKVDNPLLEGLLRMRGVWNVTHGGRVIVAYSDDGHAWLNVRHGDEADPAPDRARTPKEG